MLGLMRSLALFALVAVACQGGGALPSSGGDASDPGARDLGASEQALPPGGCRLDLDCTDGKRCLAPGASPGCGPCLAPTNPCTSDGDCAQLGAAMICQDIPCHCNGAPRGCTSGCASDADCSDGESCGADHRCQPLPCTLDSECGYGFRCVGAGGTCARPLCDRDADCAGIGFCVLHTCYPTAGMCIFPPG